MSNIYGDQHRTLQDQFNTRRLADRLEQMVLKDTLDENDKGFIASRDMFFLSTIDQHGRPTVSYKGGDPGFITIVDERTIAFPSYDGNGMYFSMGNIAGNAQVGMLFIDFESPNRLRLQGAASVSADDPLLASYVEAELIVRVAIQQVWPNCPRYIHPHKKLQASRNVPRAATETPLASWKRLEVMSDALPAQDLPRLDSAGGTISVEQYVEELAKGKP
jgi:predicted pyridoxine 5'-phosphate oxidase superfamily flavin-nucleotide-binding protein